jgi:2-keto-4-pentenoate hydratase/2-oxohepta-3-ene-1,7-dioic acid hydratase in catechol pathway
MKLMSFEHAGSIHAGLWMGEGRVLDLSRLGFRSVVEVLEQGDAATAELRRLSARPPESALLDISTKQIVAPIPRPSRNIFCIGRNYRSYARQVDGGQKAAPDPVQYAAIFTKGPNTVVGPSATVRLDPKVTELLDYEVELAAVIGKGGRDISREAAMDHIWGYTVANDITARDLQSRHVQFFKGKSLDESLPLGPWIVDREAAGDPTTMNLTLSVNGELRQKGRPDDLIFDIPSLIETLSAGMALIPGDIILTGTPAGVGYTMDPPCRLADGDVVVAKIDRIGELRNQIVGV